MVQLFSYDIGFVSYMFLGLFFSMWCRNFVGWRIENKFLRSILLLVVSVVLAVIGAVTNRTTAVLLSAGVLFLFGMFMCQREYTVLLFYTLIYCVLWFFIDNTSKIFFVIPVTIVLEGICSLLISYFCKNSDRAYAVIEYPAVLIIPVISVILEVSVYELNQMDNGRIAFDRNGFFVGLAVSVISIVLLWMIQHFSETIAEKEMWKLRASRESMEQAHYQELEKQQEEYDTILHDLKHIIRTMAVLADGDNAEEVKQLVGKVNLSIAQISDTEYSSHKILNALLLERVGFAQKKGVQLKLDVAEPLNLSRVEDLDLIAMIGNLLDNAILAESKVTNPQAVLCKIALSMDFEHIIIRVENSYEGKLFQRKHKPEGKLGEKHGIGLNSIEEIVRKYGGIMDSAAEDGRYWTKIVIPT